MCMYIYMGQFPQDGCLLIRMSQAIKCLKRFCDYISNTNIFFLAFHLKVKMWGTLKIILDIRFVEWGGQESCLKMTFVDFIQVREYIILIIIWHMKLIYLYIKALKFSELKSMLGQSSLGPLVGLRPLLVTLGTPVVKFIGKSQKPPICPNFL